MRGSVFGSGLVHVLVVAVLFIVRRPVSLVVPGPDVIQVALLDPSAAITPPAPVETPEPEPATVAPVEEEGVKIETPKPTPAKPRPTPPPKARQNCGEFSMSRIWLKKSAPISALGRVW